MVRAINLVKQGVKLSVAVCSILLILLVSCKKDDPKDEENDNNVNPSDKIVYIANEGNFQWGNASITRYNLTEEKVTNNLYESVNDVPLGDVAQSMTRIGDEVFIVVNNSGKVEVVDSRSFEYIATIEGLNSPRHLVHVGQSKAYLSDLYANAINIVNTTSHSVTGSIPLDGWAEQMLFHKGKVYVTNRHKEYLYILDTDTDAVEDSIHIQKWAGAIVMDSNNKFWVYSGGDSNEGIDAKIFKINPEEKEVEDVFSFNDAGGGNLTISPNRNTLYFLKSGVYQMDIEAGSLPGEPLINEEDKLFYSLGISPSGDIFVTDAKDYVQKGTAYHYSATGDLITSFETGIIPGSFLFVE